MSMNTFDENPFLAPRHTCANCWQKVSMVFTFGDGFYRCLFCHQNAREYYERGGILSDSFSEDDF